MPVTDPIADLLTRIRNAQHARRDSCVCPWSRHKEEICRILQREGFLAEVLSEGEGKDRMLVLHFVSGKPALMLKRASKPGRRVYSGKSALKPVLRGLGIAVLSTSAGLLTDKEARAKGIGGEVLCTVA
jgi:small subunit ribosomal protein S8